MPLLLTKATREVLQVIADSTPENPAWGLSICVKTDRGPGRVYPILDALEEEGWVTAYMVSRPGTRRPPLRCYKLTPYGRGKRQALLTASPRKRFVLALAGVR
ncbi:helix-turn-helix transcriptional regulator [Streptomyces sp. NPDC057620]|uniref:helix-turn-helix transcriptional regulator n=1 Tax=Streptomyces sp. NPDC057620 TaxID=3346185 RepID=UPI0036BB6BF4